MEPSMPNPAHPRRHPSGGLRRPGEAMRGVTWIRVQEIESGEWAIGGQPLTTQAVKAMAGR